jgi:signal transduction histidine kinase/HAMP domain-containing protein/DNA-binding response OmpR family regulator
VGTDGKLGGQAQVPGVAGTWKDLTDNVNLMAANLTGQVRNIAEVTTAVAKGDLSKKITVDVKGEILELKSTINTMVDQLNGFASEVSRVAREVGTDGKLGGQARVPGVAGTWKDLTDNVNLMAANLTGQVRNIAEVTTAVAKGDLSKKITVDVKGEILELKSTINTMLDQLNGFASEVSRVAREVGTDGKLGGQAQVPGAAGTWKDLTDNVNLMAANLTGQVRNIAEVTTAVAKGDLTKKIAVDVKGEILELKSTINTMVDQLNGFASEVSRVAREVGTDGKLGGQARVPGVAGTWKDLTDNVNLMAANLTGQVRNIAEVTTAVAKGDLTKKIAVDVKGEILELKSTINTMVDQLNGFASEVSRVAREVGSDGKLGGQARVPGVAGTWKDLTDNVNSMAANLTDQVRGIASVVNAVAKGDLKRKLVLEAKGEIAALADTINGMIDTLATFGDQVTNVAREVGIEGKLGGQARVPGAAGLWRDLTDNVNQLAANLTTQVRAIAEVATAVTKGDLTRSIMVETMGEVAVLKDNINEMIRNLKDTTLKNNEQDWLKTNLAKFTQMLQGHSDLVTVSKLVLSELAPLVNAQQGVFYSQSKRGEEPRLELLAAYASKPNKGLAKTLRIGEGLVGQCAFEKKRILLEDVPDDYIRINSVLGSATPLNVIILPVLFEGEVKAVVELASLRKFSETHLSFLEQLTESIGIVFNTIEANMRTEALLEQSQSLTKELQSQQEELKNTNDRLEQQADNLQKSERLLKNQQEELQSTNDELQDKAKLLSEQMQQVAYKNREVEHAKAALEEKAEQLALSSRYKSEFLANMSHELRTPLNSLLILAKLLSDNAANNLMPKQIDYAQTIYAAGTDLLSLINDILDLAKIESGTVTLDIAPERFSELLGYVERTFRQVAQNKGLGFTVEVDPGLPAVIQTDEKRVQQILKNLLSNAFKFTEQGGVTLRISMATSGWSEGHGQLDAAPKVVAFAVTDTGIGIPEGKQKVIFEAFQQVDGTTSRKYGGTGLGLSISRELTRLLGGDICVESRSGEGSTFTLYLPLVHEPVAVEARVPVGRAEDPRGEVRSSRPAVKPKSARSASARPLVIDDRENVRPGDLVVLIVEDDDIFAGTLREMARDSGFKAVIASDAGTALNLVKDIAPDAITLDLKLPDMEGWAVLDILKHDPETRHIPVSIISVEEPSQRYLHMGALGVVSKSEGKDALMDALARTRRMIEHDIKTLLVVSGDDSERASISEALRTEDVRISEMRSAREALAALRSDKVDCMVIGRALGDGSGADLVKEIASSQAASRLPIVMYWADDLNGGERDGIRSLAEGMVLKSAQTLEAVFAETTLFLHQAVNDLPPGKRHQLLAVMHGGAPDLAGKKALIVDDDIRNIFALTGALEQHGMAVLNAENGKDGIESLKNNPDTDVVLMDIMMPELDGYDTIRIMRGLEEFRDLPIIAVTAKAMKGDREKCIDAGASDYISKPVNVEQLLSLLRVRLAA